MRAPSVVAYVNGHDVWDGCLWFFDGEYVGREGQIGWPHYAERGTGGPVELRHYVPREDLTADELEMLPEFRDFDELEPYLAPLTPRA